MPEPQRSVQEKDFVDVPLNGRICRGRVERIIPSPSGHDLEVKLADGQLCIVSAFAARRVPQPSRSRWSRLTRPRALALVGILVTLAIAAIEFSRVSQTTVVVDRSVLGPLAEPASRPDGGYAPADRATLRCVSPDDCPGASYVTFNSFTNAPNYGDERAFVDAKDASITESGGFKDEVFVGAGKRVLLRVYVHNGAALAAIGPEASTARDTQIQVLLPGSVKQETLAAVNLTAENATPRTVSDTVSFTGSKPFTLSFDRGERVQVTYRPDGTGSWVTRPASSAQFANDQTLNVRFGDWKAGFDFAVLITMIVVADEV